MGATLKNKKLYLLTICYIVVFAIIFKLIYPEVPVTSLTIVIALLGFIFALVSNFVINRIKQKRGKTDGE